MYRSAILALMVTCCVGCDDRNPSAHDADVDVDEIDPDADNSRVDGGRDADSLADSGGDAGRNDADIRVDSGPEDADISDTGPDAEHDGDLSPLPSFTIRQHIELPSFLWHMACVDGDLYSGAYGNPNVFYLVNLEGEEFHLTIDDNGESTRVYNLGGELYVTSEGGAVFSNGEIHSDLGGHYVLAALHHDGQNLISRSPRADDSSVQLWSCTHSGCSLSRTIADIRVYDMLQYRDELFLLGRDPKGTGGSYNAAYARVYRDGVGLILSEDTNGIAVRGEVFDDRLFVGIANPARIRSYDGTTWTDEISFPGFHHLGDMIEFRGHLFAVSVVDSGNPEVWARSRGGEWTLVLDTTDLADYGVRSGIAVDGTEIVLNNAAGFFTVCEERLFMSINTTTNNRAGPGYILELLPE